MRDLWGHPRLVRIGAAAILGFVFALGFFGASLLLRVPENCQALNTTNEGIRGFLTEIGRRSPQQPTPEEAREGQKLVDKYFPIRDC